MKTILHIGVTNKATAGTEFSEIRRDHGYILDRDKIEKFNLPEITEIDDKIALYSEELQTEITPLSYGGDDIENIREIIKFYKILKEKSITTPEFALNLFYKTDDGKLLMMPPRIIAFINNHATMSQKLRNQTKYRHPELKEERSFFYSLGILLFEITTGNYPIVFSSDEDLRDKMRRKKIIKPRWENIKLSNEISTLIDDLLNIDKTTVLEEVEVKIESITKNGLYRTDKNYDKESDKNIKLKNKMLKFEEWRALFIKHRGFLTVSSIASIIIISFLGSLIFNALKPPATAGYNQYELIEAYFTSFNELDSMLIDDVLDKKIRKEDSTEISTRYVTSKMRMQTDPTARVISPEEWLTYPDDKKSGADIFGIINEKIEMLDINKYSVTYEKWFTQPASDDLSEEFKSEIMKLTRDVIFVLEQTKYSYEIVDIVIISERVEKVW